MEVFNFVFNHSPKITSILIMASFAVSILAWAGLISALDIYLNYSLIIKKFQIWRLFTTFFYFGEFNLSLVFTMYIFFRDSKILEKKVFQGKCDDYLFFIFFCMIFLLFFGIFNNILFLSSSLSYSIMYYWGRKSKNVKVELMGLFELRAPYIPVFYLFISFLLGYNYESVLYGIIVGHIYFFGRDILPRIKGLNGIRIETPVFVSKLCEMLDLNNDFIAENEDGDMFF